MIGQDRLRDVVDAMTDQERAELRAVYVERYDDTSDEGFLFWMPTLDARRELLMLRVRRLPRWARAMFRVADLAAGVVARGACRIGVFNGKCD